MHDTDADAENHPKSLSVSVCVWEPKHTLVRVAARERALAEGVMGRLLKKYGKGTKEFADALEELKLVTSTKSPDGPICAECGAFMDNVLASPGITNVVEAVRDVVHDLDLAIQRTRRAR